MTTNAMTLTFVGTRTGNAFMNELLAAIAHEVEECGATAELALERFPDTGGTVYVIVPHEYFMTVPHASGPTEEQLRRTIAICVEQPGTGWFELGYRHARRVAAAMDISAAGARELRSRGLPVEHFQLGYTEYWDAWKRDESVERGIDVLHLGTATPRRLQALASYAHTLWPHENRLLVPPVEPKSGPRPDFLVAEDKWTMLRSSKVLLNIHREPVPYFEWVRVLEALANGCVVVSEHSEGPAPLVPGKQFVSAGLDSLGLLADRLLRDEEGLRARRTAAYDFVRTELTMRPAAERLVELAEEVRRRAQSGMQPSPAATRESWNDTGEGPINRPEQDDRSSGEMANLKKVALDRIARARRTDHNEARLAGLEPDELRVLAETPAYAAAEPRVSVVVPLYNHAGEVLRALMSVAACDFDRLEIVVLDDGSTDGSADVARGFLGGHPEIPGVLLGHIVNRGLGSTRNRLLAHARGELALALDADNELYPPAISKLVLALDENPSALFAYPILEVHDNGRPLTLRSYLPWEPERLREGNYIDALALLRREPVIAIGGYTEDHRLYGWEDYDLWCRCAENGESGVLVPQILARYSYGGSSMLSVTDLDSSEAKALLRARHPRLMGSLTEPTVGEASS